MISRYFLSFMLIFFLAGCSEEEKKTVASYQEPDWDRLVAAKDHKTESDSNVPPTFNSSGVKLSVLPEQPIAGTCLVATYEGNPSKTVYVWEVNGTSVQQSSNNSYCLVDARRGDIVSVSIGDSIAGAKMSVKVANTPPQINDSRLERITDGETTYLEISPDVIDADDDFVTIHYQWIVNDSPQEEFSGDRFPATAFRPGDHVQVKMIPEDAYDAGPSYLTRKIKIPRPGPTIKSQPPKSFQAKVYTYQVEVTEFENDELTYGLNVAPPGMIINSSSGLISWPLDQVEPGEYRVMVSVTNSFGNADTQEFTISLGDQEEMESQ